MYTHIHNNTYINTLTRSKIWRWCQYISWTNEPFVTIKNVFILVVFIVELFLRICKTAMVYTWLGRFVHTVLCSSMLEHGKWPVDSAQPYRHCKSTSVIEKVTSDSLGFWVVVVKGSLFMVCFIVACFIGLLFQSNNSSFRFYGILNAYGK